MAKKKKAPKDEIIGHNTPLTDVVNDIDNIFSAFQSASKNPVVKKPTDVEKVSDSRTNLTSTQSVLAEVRNQVRVVKAGRPSTTSASMNTDEFEDIRGIKKRR
jgi:hypothetical protein